ncbi:hypothetical protein OA067_06415, partial [Gammaproteobacteria bacterium]|nr:hypothetical protein [Gammaproteobacteria bacterium]
MIYDLLQKIYLRKDGIMLDLFLFEFPENSKLSVVFIRITQPQKKASPMNFYLDHGKAQRACCVLGSGQINHY